MNAAEGIIDDLNTADLDFIGKACASMENTEKKIMGLIARVYDAIELYKNFGVKTEIDFNLDFDMQDDKENAEPNQIVDVSNCYFSQEVEQSKGNKLHNIKSEVESMPPPSMPLPKNKRSKLQKKIKQEQLDVFLARDSDIIVQNVRVSEVDLIDSDSETEEHKNLIEASRIGNKEKKRLLSPNSDVQEKVGKRPKSDDSCLHEHEENALVNEMFNSKSLRKTNKQNLNTTVVIENSKSVHSNSVNTVSDNLMPGNQLLTENTKRTTRTKIQKQIKQEKVDMLGRISEDSNLEDCGRTISLKHENAIVRETFTSRSSRKINDHNLNTTVFMELSKSRQSKNVKAVTDNFILDDKLPKRNTNRTTRNKIQKQIKQEKLEALSIISVDSDSEDEERCKMNNHEVKVEKHLPINNENDCTNIVHEDVTFSLNEKIANITFAVEPTNQAMNATIVVQNPKIVQPKTPLDKNETVDDQKQKSAAPKITHAVASASKQLFSPFQQSPVKCKVQAFERLAVASANAVRVTRSKTKHNVGMSKSTVKEQIKMFTPTTTKFLLTASSTCTKKHVHPNERPPTDTSALKSSQAEFRERERKRREKEEKEKKREALLQAQIEDKKKKREKQLKAQQQREVLEKEKRLKEEKLLAEQEKRRQKQKEEVEKKKMAARAKELEVKKAEMSRKLEGQKKGKDISQIIEKARPLYMTTRPPLLPTEDCYDSDEEGQERRVIREPAWANKTSLKHIQLRMIAIGHTIQNSFFCRQAQTPDLQDIFEVIEPKKLKRTSSAVWHKPPRFTMMPVAENSDVLVEDDEN